jgi:hypothetical protein
MRAVLASIVLMLAYASLAQAHGGDTHMGFVATVSGIEPQLPGLLVTVSGGHERLVVRNLTTKTVEIFAEDDNGTLRLMPGQTGAVSDARIGSTGPPPDQGEFVKNWRIPGEADGAPFDIVGFLGYRAPTEDVDSGLPQWVVVAAIALLGLAALALPLLLRREGEKAGESSDPKGSA